MHELWIDGRGLQHDVAVGQRALGSVLLNIQTPCMPRTTDGKAPDLEPFADLLAEAITKAAAAARRAAGPTRRRTIKEITWEAIPAAVSAASFEGRYRFSQRQLCYAIRPLIAPEIGEEPRYDTFASVLTKYDEQNGRIAGLTRAPRGTIYHPHLRQEIALGTVAVEQYRRPAWTFNKVLYCEKEGFFAILRSEQWPERHDCALLTSKGQATRAAKDLLDLLGETEEELLFFCIHDADAAGPTIYEAQQEATRTRPGRRVQVINLGLEPTSWQQLVVGTGSAYQAL
jgi:hypothetical protein